MSTSTNNAPALIAYQVTTSKDGNKNFWHRIGGAWPNSKGGFQIRLNAVPLSGEIVLLPPAETGEETREETGTQD